MALFVTLWLAGCSEPPWQTKDISGLMPPLAFELVDENGKDVNADQFLGKSTLLFFGFTHCPDVCPTTLARLDAATQRMGEAARDDIQVLFVSVDPRRDDAETLREYTDAFGPQFIGLTGDKAALDELTRRYRVTYGYGEEDSEGNYDVSHSSAVFAFNDQGEARLLIRDSDPMEAVVADLERLASGA
ncbi:MULTISPECIES: SCO family protein [Halomonas]|jgi:protein SCO1/2|nr:MULTISPECIES: SCO family protein [Halomonas]MCO7213946.1 SCO family protein [Halomonas sp. OfavH-34-E]MED5296277.1 SCO family protein [Pseudomonadota bacterium]MEE3215565.1 SCO family protein [Pseudomonadota bacterium]